MFPFFFFFLRIKNYPRSRGEGKYKDKFVEIVIQIRNSNQNGRRDSSKSESLQRVGPAKRVITSSFPIGVIAQYGSRPSFISYSSRRGRRAH